MKEVSIIIPAVKWEPFTEKCITICVNLYPESEIILVLDDIIPIKTCFDNLTVLYGETGMISKKRNAGVRVAKSEFVAFIDSDAFPHTDWLNSAVETLLKDKTIGMVGGPNISPHTQKQERNLVGMAAKSWLVAGKWNFYKSEKSSARYCDNLPSCNLVLRKKLFEKLNGMNEEMEVGEDTDFCARMIASGSLVYFNPAAIVYHYDRKISDYMRQRMVRGAGVFMHIFGNSAQKRNLYTYLLLQPLFTLLFWFSFSLGILWQPWFYVLAITTAIYVSLIFFEAVKHSSKPKFIPPVALLIFAGNILPGVGFILKAFHLLPSLHSFYRNDNH
jgi:cellulose synthase/poly-beta-1,6-N-acetylglucosamine synthase-like glycosyltransferase